MAPMSRHLTTALHGPIVRAIGPFSDLTFTYKTASELFNVNLAEAGEFDLPSNPPVPALKGDKSTRRNLPIIPNEAVNGDRNLWQFNEFCLKECGRRCATSHPFSNRNAEPPDQANVTKRMVESRDYPGYCLYFWMLRSLFDLARLSESHITSVVEDISAATEVVRSVYPSLLGIPQARQDIDSSLSGARLPDEGFTLYGAVQEFEAKFIEQALEEAGGSVTQAARLLGIRYQSLTNMLRSRHRWLLKKRTPAKRRKRSIFRTDRDAK